MDKKQKQKKYDKDRKIADTIVDGLGKPIDPGIKDLCIIMSVMGFQMKSSCEGHLKWGSLYPWVDVTYKGVKDDHKKWSEEYDRVEKIEKSSKGSDHSKLYKNLHKLRAVKQKKLSKIVIRAEDLLKKFYKKRGGIKDLDSVISFEHLSTWVRMIPYGGELQIVRKLKDREKYLKKYQKEFKDFADFLKERYFKL